MKKVILILSVVFVALACSDDNTTDQNSDFSGTLTVNGVSHQVNRGYIIKPYTGTNPAYDKRRFYVIFSDGGITLNNDNEIVYNDEVNQVIDFNLYTSAAHPGSVELTEYDLYQIGSGFDETAYIDHSSVGTDLVVQNNIVVSGNLIDSDDMTSGLVSISQENGVYSFTFSVTGTNDNVEGTFTGTLTELPYHYAGS
jgi:hypothetical protein